MTRAPSPTGRPSLLATAAVAGLLAHGAAHAAGRPLPGPTPAARASATAPAEAATPDPASSRKAQDRNATPAPHPYVGMWVTDDGYIRHELRADGRYDEARGHLRSAYQGRYTISGNHVDYLDDSGFTADGEFINGVLHHGGMVLRRVRATPASTAD